MLNYACRILPRYRKYLPFAINYLQFGESSFNFHSKEQAPYLVPQRATILME